MTHLKHIRKLALFSAVIPVVLLLLLGLLFGLAQTRWGIKQLESRIQTILSQPGQREIRIRGLRGLIPFDIYLDELVVAHPGGQWLELDGISLCWSPLSLLKGIFHIQDLEVASVHLDHLNHILEQEKTDPASDTPFLVYLQKLRVDRFVVSHIDLKWDQPDTPMEFKAEGKITPFNEGTSESSFLRINRTDSGGKVSLVASIKHQQLLIDLDVNENAKGIIPKLLGIPRPLSLTLQGDGRIESWQGTLCAAIEEVGELKANIGLSVAEILNLTTQGSLSPCPDLVQKNVAWAMGRVGYFNLSVHLDRSLMLHIDHLEFQAGEAYAEGQAVVDLQKRSSTGQFKIGVKDLGTISEAAGTDCAGNLSIESRFSGPWLQPKISAILRAQEITLGGFRVSSWDGVLDFELMDNFGTGIPQMRISGSGAMEGIFVTHAKNESKAFPDKRLTWTLDVKSVLPSHFEICQLELAGAAIGIEVFGRIEQTGGDSTLDGSLDVKRPEGVSDFLGFDLPGPLHLTFSLRGGPHGLPVKGTIRAKTAINQQAYDHVSSLLGHDLECGAEFDLTEERHLFFSKLQLSTKALDLLANGSLDLPKMELNSTCTLTVPRLGVFSSQLDHTLDGSLHIDGKVQASRDRMTINTELISQDILWDDIGFNQVTAKVRADSTQAGIMGDVSMECSCAGEKFQGAARVALKENILSFSAISVNWAQIQVQGDINLHLDQGLTEGVLLAKTKDVSNTASLFGRSIQGGMEIKGEFHILDSVQEAGFKVRAGTLTGEFGQIRGLVLNGHLTWLAQAPQGTINMNVTGWSVDDLILSSLDVKIEGSAHQASFSGVAKGRYSSAFEIHTHGNFAPSGDATAFDLLRFDCRIGNSLLALSKSAQFTAFEGKWTMDPFSFTLDQGSIEGSGSYDDRWLDASLRVTDMSLDILQSVGIMEFKGITSGNVHLSGPLDHPQGTLVLRVEDTGFRDTRYSHLPPATVSARATLKHDRLYAEASLDGFAGEPILADIDIPIIFSFSPLKCSVLPVDHIQGNLSGDLNLAFIPMLFNLPDQEVTGQSKMWFSLKGSLDDPIITGKAQIRQASYENIRTGTYLKDGELDIAANHSKLFIERGIITDGNGGNVSLGGWIDLSSAPNVSFLADLIPENAALIRHDYVVATFGGHISASGSLQKALLEGQLNISSMKIRIPERLSLDVTELDVIEIPPREQKTAQKQSPALSEDYSIYMDLSVSSPGQVFIRGRGLESEWRGNLQLKGDNLEPVISGNISVVRGYFNFLGKRFGLNEGQINLYGAIPPTPSIDLMAEYATKDITVRLKISGDLTNPSITLSSEPSFPQDEILSRILFNRSAAQITPIQAIQLAQAINTLAGGGGFDFIGWSRKWLGIEQLEITQSETATAKNGIEDPGIRVGKYLKEDVYVTVEKGMAEESGKVVVEVEVLPNITVESEIKENAEGGAGINWKWDY